MATIVTRAGKGSALTWQEGDDNFTNLNNDKIEAVSDDATPSLGGNLDVGTHSITTTEIDGDITISANGSGIVALNNDVTIGTGSADAYLSSNGARDLFITTDDGATEPYIQLQNGANGGIVIQPDGTGKITLDGVQWPNADGTNGQVLTTNGSGTLSWANASTFDPASPGAIGGTTPSTATFTQVTVNGTGELRLADTDSSNYVGFKAPGTVSTNRIWTLPSADGTNGQVLITNGSGTLSWSTVSGGSSGNSIIMLLSSDIYGRLEMPSGSNGRTTSTWTLASSGGVSGVSVSTNQFTLPAGTYLMSLPALYTTESANFDFKLYNETDTVDVKTFSPSNNTIENIDGTPTAFYGTINYYFTITGSKTYSLRTSTSRGQTWYITTKGKQLATADVRLPLMFHKVA